MITGAVETFPEWPFWTATWRAECGYEETYHGFAEKWPEAVREFWTTYEAMEKAGMKLVGEKWREET